MKKIRSVILVALCAAVAFSTAGAQDRGPTVPRYALVIGNGAYANVAKLNNPVNDANDMAAALQSLGFQVDKVVNSSLDQMISGVSRLKNRLSTNANAYGFFFYAGHGVQSGGDNYLIPVNANIPSENYLRQMALSVQSMLDELNDAKNALNIVILDACRDNPFGWSRSGSRGLNVVGIQPADSIIVYATAAGQTAADGTGRNGVFTGELLKHIKTPGLGIKDVFDRTGMGVKNATSGKQIPVVYSQFFGQAYLAGMGPVPNPISTGISIASLTSSGYPSEAYDRNIYHPVKVFDGNINTAWLEDKPGFGKGAFIRAEFSKPFIIDEVHIYGGYFDQRWYRQNNRLKSAAIFFNNTQYIIDFDDAMAPKKIYFKNSLSIESVMIRILDAYIATGYRWNDTAISEIEFCYQGKKIPINNSKYDEYLRVVPATGKK